jgi:BlaR1 peptidase M56
MHTLLIAAGRSLVLAVLTGVLLSTLRVRHPAMRKAAWAAVLIASFSMPILSGRLLHVEKLAENPISKIVKLSAQSGASVMEARHLSVEPANVGSSLQSAPRNVRFTQLGKHLLWVYWLITAGLLGRVLLGFAIAFQTWRNASPAMGPDGQLIRESSRVRSPWTFCSGILLPESARQWSRETLLLVLAHERNHIRQGDFYLQLLARIYTAVFWFSPLGWWLQRECTRLGEQTSDYAALQIAPDPKVYAELLLQICAQRAPSVVVSMARPSGLRARIHLILSEGELMNRFSSPLRAGAMAAIAVVIAIGVATASPIVRAAARPQESFPAVATSAHSNEIQGFACTVDPLIPVVGIGNDSVVRVSAGVLTTQRVEKIRKKVGGNFIAFHESGSDYVITDPALVQEAFAYFSGTFPGATPAPSLAPAIQEPAIQGPTTERERQLMQQVADLQARLSAVQSQLSGQQQLLSQPYSPLPLGREKLQVLIEQAKASGKAVRIAL